MMVDATTVGLINQILQAIFLILIGKRGEWSVENLREKL